MKIGTLAAVLLGSAVTNVYALNLVRRDNPATLSLPIERRNALAATKKRLARRATLNLGLQPIEMTAYYAAVNVGTPSQKILLDLDTGSSDMWVLASTATLCQNSGCAANGVYDSSKSSTYKFLNNGLNDKYGDGSVASGDFVTDNIEIGGAKLSDFEFGVATQYDTQVGDTATLSGILGIGYPALEGSPEEYNNLPVALAQAGLISTPAYSLWLDDLQANKGQILFGGVNKAKYKGDLATLDILLPRRSSHPNAFFVALSSISISDNGPVTQSSPTPQAALLDSGSQYTSLVEADIEFIVNHFNGSFDSATRSLVVPCSLNSSSATVDYNFGSQTINVPIRELIVGYDLGSNNKPLVGADNKPLCLIGLSAAAEGDPVILGDTFLRSAYVVYDLINEQVSIANTNFDSTTDDIVEISGDGTSADTVPGATTLAAEATAVIASESDLGNLGAATATNAAGIPVITGRVSSAGVAGVRTQFGGMWVACVAALVGAAALI